MFSLDDERKQLFQYDTGRYVRVDSDVARVHFGMQPYGTAYVVDVQEHKARIPDELLQVYGDLLCWAWVGTQENGHTKFEVIFPVRKRAKPSDYVFTPTDQKTLDNLYEHMEITVAKELDKAKETGLFDGKDGYSPVRGVDYWTEQDKSEIINDVIEELYNGDEVKW